MRDKYFYEVMFDDTSIDVSKEGSCYNYQSQKIPHLRICHR